MSLRFRLIAVIIVAALGITGLGGSLLISTQQRTENFLQLTTALDADRLRADVDLCIVELHRQLTLMAPFMMAESSSGGLESSTLDGFLDKLDSCGRAVDHFDALGLTGLEHETASEARALLDDYRIVIAALDQGDATRAAQHLALEADPLSLKVLEARLPTVEERYEHEVDLSRRAFLRAARAGDGLLGVVAALTILGTLLLIAMLISIERGIRSLIDATTAYKTGDLSHVTRKSGVPDLDRVSDQMNEMATAIVLARAQLEDRAQRLEATIETLGRTQDQLVEQQKMAALGNLVAGIAHEVNTPLGVAITAASFAEEQLREIDSVLGDEEDSPTAIHSHVEVASEAFTLLSTNLARAAQLVHSFKQVAVDRSQLDVRPVALETWGRDIMKSLSPSVRRHSIQTSFSAPGDVRVELSAGQLEQVLTNLVMNAVAHAFPPPDQRPDVMKVCEVQVEIIAEATALVLTVRDNGDGMDAETAQRVFEPFFTTRRGQERTGLGMHIVHQIITAVFHGTIQLDTSPGQGTTWRIRLPLDTDGLRRIA